MPTNNKSIQILRGNKSSLSNDLKGTILKSGQPFFDKNAKTLQIGNGTDNLDNAPYVTVKDGAINDAKVANNAAIKGSKLADASNDESNRTGITTAKIENSAITGSKIANESISDSKVATDADINGSKFKDNSISGSKLHDADGSSGITTDKIEDNAITPEKLQATGDFNAHSFSSNDDNTKEYANYGADRIVFKSTAKDSDGQVTLVPSIAVGQTVMLGLPSVDGTLLTYEEIDSGEVVAKNATYAYVDGYSQSQIEAQGTIDERLKRLGFKKGALIVPDDTNVSLNYIRKQGNIVTIWFALTGDLDITKSSQTNNSSYPGGTITCIIPDEFAPSLGNVSGTYTFFDFTTRGGSFSSFTYQKYSAKIDIISSKETNQKAQITFNSANSNIPYWSISYDITKCQPDKQIQITIPTISCPTGQSSASATVDLVPILSASGVETSPYIVVFNRNRVKFDFSGGSNPLNYSTNYGLAINKEINLIGAYGDNLTDNAVLSCNFQISGANRNLILNLNKSQTTTSASVTDNTRSNISPFTIVFLPY